MVRENEGNNVTITGTSDADLIINSSLGTGSFLDGGKGADFIANTAASVTVEAGYGDDTIVLGDAENVVGEEQTVTTLTADIITADATARTKATRIVGNVLENLILGGTGKDSLYGGNGADSIFGGAGADVFLYKGDEGNDVISGFDNSDMLLITGAFKTVVDASAKTIAFKVDSTNDAITIKNYTATSFNINGFKYKISGSKLA